LRISVFGARYVGLVTAACLRPNVEAVEWVVRQVRQHLGGSLKRRTVGFWA